VKKEQISSDITRFSIATQRILVGSHIRYWEVKERPELHNLRTDHVMIQSDLKFSIGGKVVVLKCRVFGGKTGPFPMGRVFRVVRPVATVRVRVEPEPEPTREFGPVANTSRGNTSSATAPSGESSNKHYGRRWVKRRAGKRADADTCRSLSCFP